MFFVCLFQVPLTCVLILEFRHRPIVRKHSTTQQAGFNTQQKYCETTPVHTTPYAVNSWVDRAYPMHSPEAIWLVLVKRNGRVVHRVHRWDVLVQRKLQGPQHPDGALRLWSNDGCCGGCGHECHILSHEVTHKKHCTHHPPSPKTVFARAFLHSAAHPTHTLTLGNVDSIIA